MAALSGVRANYTGASGAPPRGRPASAPVHRPAVAPVPRSHPPHIRTALLNHEKLVAALLSGAPPDLKQRARSAGRPPPARPGRPLQAWSENHDPALGGLHVSVRSAPFTLPQRKAPPPKGGAGSSSDLRSGPGSGSGSGSGLALRSG